ELPVAFRALWIFRVVQHDWLTAEVLVAGLVGDRELGALGVLAHPDIADVHFGAGAGPLRHGPRRVSPPGRWLCRIDIAASDQGQPQATLVGAEVHRDGVEGRARVNRIRAFVLVPAPSAVARSVDLHMLDAGLTDVLDVVGQLDLLRVDELDLPIAGRL